MAFEPIRPPVPPQFRPLPPRPRADIDGMPLTPNVIEAPAPVIGNFVALGGDEA